MIADMPRIRPPHLTLEPSRHGQPRWYVRVGKGRRIRILEEYGTPEFGEAYQAAVTGSARSSSSKAAKGSLTWLVAQYRDSAAWAALSSATRRQRENIFKHVLETAGPDPAGRVTNRHIDKGLERRGKTPSQARNFLDAMRGLFEWAKSAQHVRTDPTAGIKAPPRPRTQGFPVWTEDDVTAYEARWPVGTKERVWLDVLLYTGLRRGDAVRLGRQHVRNGVATIRTEKSQDQVTITIPLLPVLAATLEAGPTGELAFICGVAGKPFAKESFGNEFSAAARAAGVRKSAHGVRKIGATRAAENGATVAELEAIFGWQGGGMAALYTRAADRARLARAAMGKLVRTPAEQPIPAPDEKVRAAASKSKRMQGLKK